MNINIDLFNNLNCNFNKKILYITPEIGIDDNKINYAGGLGILAGDFVRTFNKMGCKLYSFCLKYKKAYSIQNFDERFNQINLIEDLNYDDYHQILHNNLFNREYLIIKINNDELYCKLYKKDFGNVQILLLEYSHNLKNTIFNLTDLLYDGSRKNRLLQEIILGQGAIKAAKLLDLNYDILHINEGHAAFAFIERINQIIDLNISNFDDVIKGISHTNCFTTHTPVIHGNEEFDIELIKNILTNSELLRYINLEKFLELGKFKSKNIFSMTALSIALSKKINAVSKLHSKVSNKMWKTIRKSKKIIPITNGIDIEYWMNDEFINLLKQNPNVSAKKLFKLKQEIKTKYIKILNDNKFFNNSKPLVKLFQEVQIDNNSIIVGFARRFAPYKRADLLFKNIDSFFNLINNYNIIFLFSGKAHPDDTEGQKIITNILQIIKKYKINKQVIFFENYNINIAKILFQVSDLWLNTPIRLLEACGTSGMKAALNGCVNYSVLDGWWDETYRKSVGFKIFNRKINKIDDIELSTIIHNQFIKDVIPKYYDKPYWSKLIYNGFNMILNKFSTRRMILEYINLIYK